MSYLCVEFNVTSVARSRPSAHPWQIVAAGDVSVGTRVGVADGAVQPTDISITLSPRVAIRICLLACVANIRNAVEFIFLLGPIFTSSLWQFTVVVWK